MAIDVYHNRGIHVSSPFVNDIDNIQNEKWRGNDRQPTRVQINSTFTEYNKTNIKQTVGHLKKKNVCMSVWRMGRSKLWTKSHCWPAHTKSSRPVKTCSLIRRVLVSNKCLSKSIVIVQLCISVINCTADSLMAVALFQRHQFEFVE